MGCHEGSSTKGHAGDEEGSHEARHEEGSHEAPCHEGCGTSGTKGHEGDEEGSHEARHEGCGTSGTKGYAGDEEGSHEAPCHEGCGTSGTKSHAGNEEETHQRTRSEASCLQGPFGQDNIWSYQERLHGEQTWQGRQQEEPCPGAEAAMDGCCGRSAEGLEHHGLGNGEEGNAAVQEGEGVHGST